MKNYEEEFNIDIGDKNINVGIISGDNLIVVIIPGQNSDIYGYENRYLKLSNKINTKYGASVIIFSNPFQLENPMEYLMDVIKDYASRFNSYRLYFFGFSKGANIGAQYATKERGFTRMVLINGPLMINFHKTKEGISNFKGERISFVYGSLDPSFKYMGLLTLEEKDNVKTEVLENLDHNVKDESVFLNLVDDYLFYDY